MVLSLLSTLIIVIVVIPMIVKMYSIVDKFKNDPESKISNNLDNYAGIDHNLTHSSPAQLRCCEGFWLDHDMVP